MSIGEGEAGEEGGGVGAGGRGTENTIGFL